jgi:GST-like protein
VVPVNIGKGQQFTPEFLAISPNNRMPAIVDSDGPDGQLIAIFESGAILIYLADKIGRFFPIESRCRYEVLPWLMFQMSGVGPMFGQAGHFTRYAPEKIPYAIDRYTNESHRLCRVLDTRPAVEPALAVLADKRQVQGQLTDEARSILFGERQIKGR